LNQDLIASNIFRHVYTNDRIIFQQGVDIFRKKNCLKEEMTRFFKNP